MTEHSLDARRLLCPLPVIRTQDRVKSLAPGDCLTVVCTDRGAVHDIPTWCRLNGHEVLAIEEDDYEMVIRLRVGKPVGD
ncbi:MAG: sulfurtransferase TusA family protein [Pseudomonadota bacterium]